MSVIRRSKRDTSFVQIDSRALKDERLSWKAKGLLAYLLCLPDDWRIYISELTNHATDGRDSTRAGINELMKFGYIQRDVLRQTEGQFAGVSYVVTDIPIQNPDSELPMSENPISGKQPLPILYNTNTENNLSKGEIEIFDENHEALQPPNMMPFGNFLVNAKKALDLYYSWSGKIDELRKEVGYEFDEAFLNEQKKSFVEKMSNYSHRSARTFSQLKGYFITWVKNGWERRQKEKSYKATSTSTVAAKNETIGAATVENEKLAVIAKYNSKEKLTSLERTAIGILSKKSGEQILKNMEVVMTEISKYANSLAQYQGLSSTDIIWIELNYPSEPTKRKIIEAIRAVVKYHPRIDRLIEAIKIQTK